jgi:hypothetical protein
MDNSKFVPVNLASGAAVGMEITEVSANVVDPEKGVAGGALRFADVLTPIEAIACEMGAMLQRVAPSKASVEFGVEVGMEAGQLTALIVKGSGKANLKITLHWDGHGSTSQNPSDPPK